jgi:excisionase family DNA binding protein
MSPAVVDNDTESERLAVSPERAGRKIGLGRTKIYELIACGDLRTVKIGSRRLVLVASLHELLAKYEVQP